MHLWVGFRVDEGVPEKTMATNGCAWGQGTNRENKLNGAEK
jgi:hypothetical protein